MFIAAFFLLAANAVDPSPPALVELFTSQSCSSCPSAEANFRTLAARHDIVALEWHVDYWNDISIGRDGRWRDPFSAPENTERQRRYNAALRGRSTVYTPQIVINGAVETVGSRNAEIDRLISISPPPTTARVAVTNGPGGVEVAAAGPAGSTLRIVRFLRTTKTAVEGGENAGAILAEAHVVTGTEIVATLKNGRAEAAIAPPGAGEGCAILVESPGDGGPLAARYCP